MFFRLTEVDEHGKLVAAIHFDPDDRRAASIEMLDRFAESNEARSIPGVAFDAIRAMNAHDLDRLRAALPEDFVVHDHRRTGFGRLASADTFVASLAALLEQTPDFTVETLYQIAIERHGDLAMVRGFGTLAGGSEFDLVYVRLGVYRAERMLAMELYEPEDLDAARARLEALRPET